jgi:hypothetical protein
MIRKSAIAASLLLASWAFAQDGEFRRGAITLKVKDYAAATAELKTLAEASGGRVVDQNTNVGEKGLKSGWSRVRIPKAALGSVMEQVAKFGLVHGQNQTQDNRSREVAELEKRSLRLDEHRARLLGILNGNRRLRGGDILFVQERVFRASVDADLLRSQREALLSDSQSASIIVTFFEPSPVKTAPPVPKNLGERFQFALARGWDSLGHFAARAITGLAYVLAYSVLVLPILFFLVWGWRRFLKSARFAKLKAAWLNLIKPPTPPDKTDQ